jgi:hypothetical protein
LIPTSPAATPLEKQLDDRVRQSPQARDSKGKANVHANTISSSLPAPYPFTTPSPVTECMYPPKD